MPAATRLPTQNNRQPSPHDPQLPPQVAEALAGHAIKSLLRFREWIGEQSTKVVVSQLEEWGCDRDDAERACWIALSAD